MIDELEQKVVELAVGSEVSGMFIAETLASIEDSGEWREKVSPRYGKPYTVFKQYLRDLAKRIWEVHGVRASEGNYERLLSHYRLFVQTMGASIRDTLEVGVANLDLLRTMYDWDFRTRTLGPGKADEEGRKIKLGAEDAVAHFQEVIRQTREHGTIPNEVLKAELDERLGRASLQPRLTFRKTQDAHGQPGWRLTALDIWEGGTVHRAFEFLTDEKKNWLAKRLRAGVEEVEF